MNADGEIVSKEVGEEERPDALVRAEARAPALLALAPDALVRADARPPALLASAPLALVRADARPPALLAPAPDALMRADARTQASRLLGRGVCPCCAGLTVALPLASALAPRSHGRRRPGVHSPDGFQVALETADVTTAFTSAVFGPSHPRTSATGCIEVQSVPYCRISDSLVPARIAEQLPKRGRAANFNLLHRNRTSPPSSASLDHAQ